MLNPADAVGLCLRKYAGFGGRASRSEYWWFQAFWITGWAILSLVDRGGVLSALWLLAMVLPGLAVAVRRLHDIGRSGWNTLWAFLVFGLVLLLMYFLTGSQLQPNKYGEIPLAARRP